MSAYNQYTKFRPYLTVSELETIISSLRTNGENPGLIYYLSGFRDKITVGRMAPQLATKPTLTDKLELSSSSVSVQNLSEQRLRAYTKWITSPNLCSIQELARARMYRYENDMMTPEEESEYESTLDKGY